MSFALMMKPGVEADLEDIIAHYDSISSRLGDRFVEAVDRKLDLILENPFIFHDRFEGVRLARLNYFPYGIYFFVDEPYVYVFGISHLHRNPDWIKKKLSD